MNISSNKIGKMRETYKRLTILMNTTEDVIVVLVKEKGR